MQTVALPQVNAIPQQGHSVPPVMPAGAAAAGNSVTTSRRAVDLPSLKRGEIRDPR